MSAAFMVRGDDGVEYGPVEMAELREWVLENRAGLGSSVRRDEPGALWQPWQYYPELVALLAESRSGGLASGSVLAPLPSRFLALVVDLILTGFLLVPIFLVICLLSSPEYWAQISAAYSAGAQPAPPQLSPLIVVLLDFVTYAMVALYAAGFHAAHGRTPAKSILRLQVVDERGRKPTLGRALLRGGILSLEIFCYGLPLLWVFFHPQRRALHDLAAGTYVVEL